MLPLFDVHIVRANELVIVEIYVNICLFFPFIFSGYYSYMELICLHVIINEDTLATFISRKMNVLSKACARSGIFMFSQIIQCVFVSVHVWCVPNSYMSMSIMYGFGYSRIDKKYCPFNFKQLCRICRSQRSFIAINNIFVRSTQWAPHSRVAIGQAR